MRRGRVFVNSVFHNMWGEFDVNRALFFLEEICINQKKSVPLQTN
jgi:hypothetical protein